MKIVFATNNAHKLAEVQAVLGDAYELVTPRMCGVEEEIPENQPTLEGNASEKSHYLRARTGLDCFADDTGLEVEALDGAPGVHSARYASDGHRRIFCKQVLHHDIHPGVGTLGRQPDAHQQLPGVVVVQRAACVGILRLEPPDDLQSQLFFGRQVFGRDVLSAHIFPLVS